jgi:hypothetical protein
MVGKLAIKSNHRTLPSRLEWQKLGRLNSIHDKQRKAGLQKPKLLRRFALMNSSSTNDIDSSAHNLACFKELPLRDQGVFLLKRLALLFPRNQSFMKVRLAQCTPANLGPNGLAFGFPEKERREALSYLLDGPWRELMDARYIDKESLDYSSFEITAVGWAAIESNTFEYDDYLDKIFPESVRPARVRNGAKRGVTYRGRCRIRNPQRQRKN